MPMSSAGRAGSSSGCVTKPKERETGLSGFAVSIQVYSLIGSYSWQRPNIGSRMNREVHVRVWERAEVKFLRATRQKPALPRRSIAVRFAPNKQTPRRRVRCDAKCQKLTRAVQQIHHSITSSARIIRGKGTSTPSALAVLRLMTSSSLVACWNGRVAGFSPLRICPTYRPPTRKVSPYGAP